MYSAVLVLVYILTPVFGSNIALLRNFSMPSFIDSDHAVYRRTDTPNNDVHVYLVAASINSINSINNTLNELRGLWARCSGDKMQMGRVTFTEIGIPNCNVASRGSLYPCNTRFCILVLHGCRNGDILGMAEVTGKYSWIYDSDATFNPQLYAHELGHNMGLGHAASLSNEYGDSTGSMGQCCTVNLCYNIVHQHMLGWTVPVRISTTGIYSLNESYIFASSFYLSHGATLNVYERKTTNMGRADSLLLGRLQVGDTFDLQDTRLVYINPTSFKIIAHRTTGIFIWSMFFAVLLFTLIVTFIWTLFR